MSNEIIEAVIENEDFMNGLKDYSDEISEQNIFKSLDLLTEEDDEIINKLVFDGKLPDREFINRVKMSGLGISLQLVQLARKLSAKLQIIEKYLSRLEDKLFDERTINSMNTAEAMQLYSQTRILFERTEAMLLQIQERVDIENIEMTLKTLLSKEGLEEDGIETQETDELEDLDEILDMIASKKREKALKAEENIKTI